MAVIYRSLHPREEESGAIYGATTRTVSMCVAKCGVMEKIGFFLLVAVMFIAGCSKEYDDAVVDRNMAPIVISASVDDGDATRVVLDSDGKRLFWESDDSLSVFLGTSTMHCAYIHGVPNGTNADFMVNGDIILGGSTDSGGEQYTNVAFYPFDKDVTMVDVGVLAIDFPSVQKAVPNSIPRNAPMAASVESATTEEFMFRNVSSFIKFVITADETVGLSSILLTSNGSPLSGASTIYVSHGDEPQLTISDDGNSAITLDCDGIELGTTPVVLYMALPPYSFGEGELSLRFNDTDGGSMVKELPAFTFERSRYYTLELVVAP